MTTKELIAAAMSDIENIACGGVGANGATREELDACAAAGHPCEGDTDYHQCQSHGCT